MNYNNCYNNDFEWDNDQTSSPNFPDDWNFDEEGYSYNKTNCCEKRQRKDYGNNKRGNCYYGQFIICEKGQGSGSTRPERCNAHADKGNHDCEFGKENGNGRNFGNRQPRSCCRCPICNFFRNFHC